MDILIKALQLILSLSILVLFHELGHYVAARIFKTRVESFYLFFNPWFSLFKYKYGDTTYGIGWLPLGGYVKIAGMIDESLDREQMAKPPQPWEFRSKPAWQRLIIMVGGVTVNLILAFAIYISILTIWGERYLPASEVKYGITIDSLAYEMGLRAGDKIISVDGKIVEDFYKIPSTIILNKATSVQVLRNEIPVTVDIPEGFINKLLKHRSPSFIGVRFPFIVSGFIKDSPAEAAGVKPGDKILGFNDMVLPYFDEFRSELQNHKGEAITVLALRETDTVRLRVQVSENGTIGVYPVGDLEEFFSFRSKQYNFLEAIPAGIVRGYHGVANYLKQLKLIFSPKTKAYESLGGFITIGSIFPATWDWQAFWELTAFLSIMLAILNILPIPALDGGHVLFLLYEIISGRKPGDKFMEYAQIAGMLLLLALVIFANANDIRNLFR